MEKKALRKELRAKNRNARREQRVRESALLVQMITQAFPWQQYSRVYAYRATSDEPRLEALWNRLLEDGLTVAFPRVEGERIRYYVKENLSSGWVENRWGIREPAKGRVICPDDPGSEGESLIFVPGMAFDEAGFRLGHGGGFYDRFLSRYNRRLFSVGVCFSWQRVPKIPTEAHDIPVDRVYPGGD